MLWLFLFGSVIGFILEGIWCIITKGAWENHAATVWGPFCIIYGIAAMLLYALSFQLKKIHMAWQFVICTLVGTGIEYFSSLFQELCFGSTSWNYANHFLNLGGRVSLRMALMWGILGIAFVKFVFPLLARLLQKTRGRGGQIACICATVFMVINLLLTVCAVGRWSERIEDKPASNRWEEFLDERFDDARMRKTFPNMDFKNSEEQ